MIITDEILGEIRLVSNSRARRIIVRKKDGYLQLTHPSSVSLSYIHKTIEEMRPRLQQLLNKSDNSHLFTPQTEFHTSTFKLNIIENALTTNCYTSLKDGVLSISFPVGTDFRHGEVQQFIRKSIEKALRYEASRILPDKVKKLAEKYGFTYSTLKINKSRGRWGSCSSRKSINLSLYCMLLPEYLIDFVILHELCHTIEMNHGEHFWDILDKVAEGKSKQYTQELKHFKIVI